MNVKVDFDSLNLNIEELLKRSKYLQNKMRQELSRHTEISLDAGSVGKEMPPVGDNERLFSYVKNIVADHLQDKSSLLIKSNEIKNSNVIEEASKSAVLERTKMPPVGNGVRLVPNVRSLVSDGEVAKESKESDQKIELQEPIDIQVRDSLLSSRRMAASVGTQFERPTTKKVIHQCALKRKTIQRSVLKESPLRNSKSCLESNKSLNKLSATTIHRLPLQRFSEPSQTNIDFSKEHPDLELDQTAEQTTLFPRRFQRQTNNLPAEEESVNVAEAELKPIQPVTAVVQQETWNGILSKNRPKIKLPHKIVRLKQKVDVVAGIPNDLHLQRANIKGPKEGLDIISSTQANGLFMLQKQSEQLDKQKRCRFQRFPVMYIRPECKVQKVSNISIRSESVNIFTSAMDSVGENASENIKYVECKHEDETNVELKTIPDSLKIDAKENDDNIQANAKNNKFFKALEFSNLCENSTSSRASSPFIRQSSSSSQTLSSVSSTSSLKHESPSENLNKNTMADVMFPSERLLSAKVTQDLVKSPPIRREVHVQTEYQYKKTVATSTSPLPTPAQSAKSPSEPEVTSSIMNDTFNILPQANVAASQSTPKIEGSVEDDIIAKIFERIRNDVPNALLAFKNRNSTTSINLTTTPPISHVAEEQYQEQKIQKHPHQMSAISDVSNIELLPNAIETHLARVQGKRQGGRHSQTISPSPIVSIDPTPMPVGRELVLLQQNPLFVQTINRIKSSAVHDAMSEDGRIKQKRHEYPTDAEIKRAVKIFIDSLTFDGCGGEKKAIINDVGGARRKFMPLPKSELINSDRLSKYTSSDSLNTSNSPLVSSSNSRRRNVKRMSKTSRWCGVSGSSTSTGLSSSDLESESEITNDMHRLTLNKNNNRSSSKSDGEVLSIGEI